MLRADEKRTNQQPLPDLPTFDAIEKRHRFIAEGSHENSINHHMAQGDNHAFAARHAATPAHKEYHLMASKAHYSTAKSLPTPKGQRSLSDGEAGLPGKARLQHRHAAKLAKGLGYHDLAGEHMKHAKLKITHQEGIEEAVGSFGGKSFHGPLAHGAGGWSHSQFIDHLKKHGASGIRAQVSQIGRDGISGDKLHGTFKHNGAKHEFHYSKEFSSYHVKKVKESLDEGIEEGLAPLNKWHSNGPGFYQHQGYHISSQSREGRRGGTSGSKKFDLHVQTDKVAPGGNFKHLGTFSSSRAAHAAAIKHAGSGHVESLDEGGYSDKPFAHHRGVPGWEIHSRQASTHAKSLSKAANDVASHAAAYHAHVAAIHAAGVNDSRARTHRKAAVFHGVKAGLGDDFSLKMKHREGTRHTESWQDDLYGIQVEEGASSTAHESSKKAWAGHEPGPHKVAIGLHKRAMHSATDPAIRKEHQSFINRHEHTLKNTYSKNVMGARKRLQSRFTGFARHHGDTALVKQMQTGKKVAGAGVKLRKAIGLPPQ